MMKRGKSTMLSIPSYWTFSLTISFFFHPFSFQSILQTFSNFHQPFLVSLTFYLFFLSLYMVTYSIFWSNFCSSILSQHEHQNIYYRWNVSRTMRTTKITKKRLFFWHWSTNIQTGVVLLNIQSIFLIPWLTYWVMLLWYHHWYKLVIPMLD